jgi:hypothetical protein
MPFPHGCKGDEACIFVCLQTLSAGLSVPLRTSAVFGSLAGDVTAGRSVTNNLEGPNSGCRVAKGPQEHARRY